MNKDRRTAIDKLSCQLQDLSGQVRDIMEQIDSLKDDEQEYYDNMPESFQQGEKGELASAAVDALESASSNLYNIDTELDEAIDYLGTAME